MTDKTEVVKKIETKNPDKTTRQAIKDVKYKRNLNHAKNKEDFFRQLEN